MFAAAIELTVITRLFTAPRVIVLVATIGVAQLALAAQIALPTVSKATVDTPYPTALTGTWTVAGVKVQGAELSVLIAVPLITLALTWFLTRTDIGKAVRAAAANPDRARLSAINPKRLSTLVWTIGGLLSAVTLILLAGTSGSAVGLTAIGPDTLGRVLAAALIARMVSFPRALAAGVAIGIVEALVKYNTPTQAGVFDGLLFVVVLITTWLISRNADRDDDASFSFAPRSKPIPERLRAIWWVRMLPRIAGALALIVAVAVPLVITTPSRQFLYANVLLFALIALSLVVLTGWAGQVSLGQAAFAGIGALGFAALVNGNPIGLGYGTHRVVIDLPKFPPVVALIVMTAACALVAVAIGAGALRVRGLLLAIVTFTFALAAQQYIFQLPFLSGGVGGGGSVFVERPVIASIDFASQRAYYYVALIALAVAMVLVARLRRSGIGRAMIGVRDNADAAAAYTVSPARTKLMSFALAGAIAGFGGALLGLLFSTISIGEVFTVNDSLQLIAVAVIGGVGSVAGPILGALWVVGLPAFWPSSLLIPLFTSSIGLLLLLMFCPGGLVQIGYSARDALFAWLDRRLPASVEAPKSTAMPRARGDRHPTEHVVGDVLTTQGVSVRFGGRVAVDDVAIRVGAHEVVGLVGTNGAGKTTLMNAIGGFVPAGGSVELLGRDITRLAPERRARLGLGRTFQAARLFGDLTVRETLQLALEARHRTGFVSTALFLPRGFRVDRRQRAGSRRDHRVSRARSLRRTPLCRALHRHPSHRRARRAARARRARPLSRRAHCRRRATRDRSLRAAAAPHPRRARRIVDRHRTRHAADHVDQRPRLLPRGGRGHRRGQSGRGPRRPRRRCVVPGHRSASHPTQRLGPRTGADADQLTLSRARRAASAAQLATQIDLADLARRRAREVDDDAQLLGPLLARETDRARARSVMSRSSIAGAPGARRTIAHACSPSRASGAATTATSAICGSAAMASSISAAEMFSPPRMITSFRRSVIVRKPSSSSTPMSPVRYQPSSSNAPSCSVGIGVADEEVGTARPDLARRRRERPACRRRRGGGSPRRASAGRRCRDASRPVRRTRSP